VQTVGKPPLDALQRPANSASHAQLKLDTIWRYVFSEVVSPTILGCCLRLVFLMNAIFELAELAIKKDLSIRSVVTICSITSPESLR